jgi:hypothetical protein
VGHHRHIGFLVGFERGAGVRREHANGFAARIQHAREARQIGLHPVGRPIHGAVFPGAEPQQVDAETLGARPQQDAVEVAEVELAFLALDFVPIHRILDGVGAHALELGPGALHAVREGAVVVDLAAQDEERLPVHHEGELAAGLHQLRNGFALRGGKGSGGCQERSQQDEFVRHRADFPCHPARVAPRPRELRARRAARTSRGSTVR